MSIERIEKKAAEAFAISATPIDRRSLEDKVISALIALLGENARAMITKYLPILMNAAEFAKGAAALVSLLTIDADKITNKTMNDFANTYAFLLQSITDPTTPPELKELLQGILNKEPQKGRFETLYNDLLALQDAERRGDQKRVEELLQKIKTQDVPAIQTGKDPNSPEHGAYTALLAQANTLATITGMSGLSGAAYTDASRITLNIQSLTNSTSEMVKRFQRIFDFIQTHTL